MASHRRNMGRNERIFTYSDTVQNLCRWRRCSIESDKRLLSVELFGRCANHRGAPLLLGRTASISSSLRGALDEVAVYDKALTPAQVLAHFQAGGGVRPPAFQPGPDVKFTLLNLLTCEDDTSPTNCPGGGPDGVSPTSVGGEYVVELKSGDSTVWTTPELGYDDRAAGQGSCTENSSARGCTRTGRDTGDIYKVKAGLLSAGDKVRRWASKNVKTFTSDGGKTAEIRVRLTERDTSNDPEIMDLGAGSGTTEAKIMIDLATGDWTVEGIKNRQYLRGTGDPYSAILGFDIALDLESDEDSDGLLDTWEKAQAIRTVDVDKANPVGSFTESTVLLAGSNPNRRDLYVESDWTFERRDAVPILPLRSRSSFQHPHDEPSQNTAPPDNTTPKRQSARSITGGVRRMPRSVLPGN